MGFCPVKQQTASNRYARVLRAIRAGAGVLPADAAVCALESLISSNKLQVPGRQQQAPSESQASAVAYIKAAAATAGSGASGSGLVGLRSLCSRQGQLLEPHEALLW